MTKYQGKIEAKITTDTEGNLLRAKNQAQYFQFVIDKKKWNCFDAITNQEFKIGDYVEFETIQKGEYENLLPETMKLINAPELAKGNLQAANLSPLPTHSGDCIHKNINENPDSLEIGTPSKGGAIKVYHNYDDPEGFLVKILNAKSVRDEANKLFNPETPF